MSYYKEFYGLILSQVYLLVADWQTANQTDVRVRSRQETDYLFGLIKGVLIEYEYREDLSPQEQQAYTKAARCAKLLQHVSKIAPWAIIIIVAKRLIFEQDVP